MRKVLTGEVQKDSFNGLADVWAFLCTCTSAVLAIVAVENWGALVGQRYSAGWWLLLLKTGIAATTELRFYLGHRNYLKNVGQDRARGRAARLTRVQWDFLLVCCLTSSKLAMAWSLSNSRAFINGFIFLMFSDLLWMFFEPRVRSLGNISTFKPCRWMWINLATAVLILLGSQFSVFRDVDLVTIGTVWQLSIAATNCLADLWSCCGPVMRHG